MSNQNVESRTDTKVFLPIAAIVLGIISLALLSINISLGAKWDDALCNVGHLFGLTSFITGLLGVLLIKKELGISPKLIWIGFICGILMVICHILVWIRNFIMFMIYVQ